MGAGTSIDPGRVTILTGCTDYEGVARYRHGQAEVGVRPRVGRLDIRLLSPVRSAAHEHIGRSGLRTIFIVLVTIHARGGAVLAVCSDYESIARNGYRGAE